MSRAFVKEDDQEQPHIVPPRAALPEGEINYVTPNGLQELKEEQKALEAEKENLDAENEQERRRTLALINGKLTLLQERIASAQVLDPKDNESKEVRFGAHVTYKMPNMKKAITVQIVGVDEADIKKQKIAFVSPVAKAMTGAQKGDQIEFDLGGEKRKVEIVGLEY